MNKKRYAQTLCLLSWLSAPVWGDIFIYNTTNEKLNCQVMLPNGDTRDSPIEEDRGYGPTQTTLTTSEGKMTSFRILSESGKSGMDFKSPNNRCYVLYKKGETLQCKPVSWCSENGQIQKREMVILNATGAPQSFELVDEVKMRSISLQPGEEVTVEAKNGFSGSSGFHHFKFAGHRLDNAASSGFYVILFNSESYPGKVQAGNYGYLSMPRNTVLK